MADSSSAEGAVKMPYSPEAVEGPGWGGRRLSWTVLQQLWKLGSSQPAAPPKAGVWQGGAASGASMVQLAESSHVFKAGKEQGHGDGRDLSCREGFPSLAPYRGQYTGACYYKG